MPLDDFQRVSRLESATRLASSLAEASSERPTSPWTVRQPEKLPEAQLTFDGLEAQCLIRSARRRPLAGIEGIQECGGAERTRGGSVFMILELLEHDKIEMMKLKFAMCCSCD